jgi:hypothetical protein
MTTDELISQMRRRVESLSEDDQIKIRCIRSTIRNVHAAGGAHASIAIMLECQNLIVEELAKQAAAKK